MLVYLWPPYAIGQAIIFLPCGFYLSFFFYLFFFPRLISAAADWMSTILRHMMWLSANLECMSELCCTRLAGNTGRKNRHLSAIAPLCRAISSQLKHLSTFGKKVMKQQYLLHIMSLQYSERRPINS